MKDLLYFVDEEGREPFLKWLTELQDEKARATIQARLDRLRFGLIRDSKFLGSGVYELKISLGLGYRIYFGNDGETKVILLLGGSKKTQERDIAKAKIYWQKFKSA